MGNVIYSKISGLVGNANASITTIFREKGSCWSSGWHNGIDIAASQGTPIKAAADGVVVNTDTVAHNDGFGNRVIIRHADGRATLYAHMMSTPSVKVGQAVKKGEVIGKVGNTGLSYGAHLHFTVIDNYDRNPNIYYKGDLLDPIKVCGLGTIKLSGEKTIVENGISKYIPNLNAYYSTSMSPVKPTSKPQKSVDELAKEVIRGEWGAGQVRKDKLTAAGYDYSAVQKCVNEMLSVKPQQKPLKSVDEIAREVIQGKWGNGDGRVKKLAEAGYDSKVVQTRVNQMLKYI